MNRIRIFLIDDDLAWLSALKTFLSTEEDFIIIGTAANREHALDFIEKNQDIDVVLLDVNLTANNLDGISLALEILDKVQVNIIMLTALEDEDVVRNSIAAGADQFVSKVNYRLLPHIIRALKGKSDPMRIIASEYRKILKEHYLKELTPEERKIYNLLEKGYSRTKIEQELMKSENTLKIQIKSILKKLGAINSKDAVKKVKRLGL
ncbi:response regulator containing a CheY-like receiver domain and an HTH DNA-binding domain (plasmid) [Thermobacillus composti KWC4]|uniref:Response regulator containing a CheY-like receiver domain and an HTH DNA-binding domain n=1 Tax=Thermobacillus composti (strain DSM 18247 / JCM 13945 / KWC4) TaxID=717605 RepID=L0EK40_THECK|nr:response regulator transcription factor [Thermobacillus composti]AGA60059.1 response regulator containing a CheY-like receiver domain and an HTH DNA-binding domain [Thermobacillus composti KWC4]